MASLLEGGPSSVPVEFVQTSCSQPESYDSPTTKKTMTNTTIDYNSQRTGAGAVKTTSSVLHHHTVAQSLQKNTTQEHTMGTWKKREIAEFPASVWAVLCACTHVLSS